MSTSSASSEAVIRARVASAKVLAARPLPADDFLVAGTRLFLAASGLLINLLIPLAAYRWVYVSYLVLSLYTLYSLAVFVLRRFQSRAGWFVYDWGHWIDVSWYTLLVILTSGTNSIFFLGYLFPIVVASFRWGFASGMRVTVASACLFSGLGWLVDPPDEALEKQRFVIRPLFLCALGYMVASRGRLELRLRRRLQFLKDAATVANPRFGTDRTLGILMHRTLRHYDADGCALVLRDAATGRCELRRARREDPEGPVPSEAIPAEMAAKFLAFPENQAAAYWSADGVKIWSVGDDGASALAPVAGADYHAMEDVAAILEAGSFLSAPVGFREQLSGRLYLMFAGRRVVDEADASFLLQIIDHAFPLIDNIRLVDRLAVSAAQEERRRIARDLHDSVIQPYVGLHMGLAALRQKVAPKDSQAAVEVERLMELARLSIEDLRGQVSTLRDGAGSGGGFVSAVSRLAARFTEATGIGVIVDAPVDVAVTDQIAGEAFHMVTEGLSNIRRHTQASRAFIRCASLEGRLRLTIENEGAEGDTFRHFTPKSIVERAAALGGRVDVGRTTGGGAAVHIEIPL